MRDVVILGSTGSIGTQALDLVRANPDRFRVVGLTAGGGNPDLFERQVAEVIARHPGAFSGLGEEASVEAAPAAVRRRAQRHHRRCRAPADAGRARGRGARWRSPTRSRSSSAARWSRSAPSPARSCRSTASTARSRRACAAAATTRYDASCSPRAAARSADGPAPSSPTSRPSRRWPTQLRRWAGDHHQLGDPRQQGPRGDRGAPPLRRAVRPDRRRRPPPAAHPLDGRVHRRRRRSPRSACRRCWCRSPSGWPGPTGSPTRRRRSTGRKAGGLAVLAARRRGLPGGRAGPRGGQPRRHGPGGLQRGQRGVRGRLPRRSAAVPGDRRRDRHAC